MKKLAMTVIISGLLSTGLAYAANSEGDHNCQKQCASHCSHFQEGDNKGSTFKPLFPEHEVKAPMGG